MHQLLNVPAEHTAATMGRTRLLQRDAEAVLAVRTARLAMPEQIAYSSRTNSPASPELLKLVQIAIEKKGGQGIGTNTFTYLQAVGSHVN